MAESAPAFLTTREVAELLRVKERKVYDLAASGGIPCRRVTGKLLFPRAEIEAWLARGAIGGSAAAKQKPAPANIVAGSHDPLLDWAIRESGSGLATFFDGSLDGLERMARGEAAIAGLHVFEAERGDWNLDHVRDKLETAPVVLVEWARRQQGLLLAEGLAGKVKQVADLASRRVARRQPSAGAGLLLDHLIAEAGLRGKIHFETEFARTETEAAAAVASGQAEAAPGLAAMARQFGLGFLPTVVERFDLVVDRHAWFEPPFQRLLAFCTSAPFIAKAKELGGYDLSGHGRVVWNAP